MINATPLNIGGALKGSRICRSSDDLRRKRVNAAISLAAILNIQWIDSRRFAFNRTDKDC